MKRRKLCTGFLVVAFSAHQAFGVVGAQVGQDGGVVLPAESTESAEAIGLGEIADAVKELQADIEGNEKPCDELLTRLDELETDLTSVVVTEGNQAQYEQLVVHSNTMRSGLPCAGEEFIVAEEEIIVGEEIIDGCCQQPTLGGAPIAGSGCCGASGSGSGGGGLGGVAGLAGLAGLAAIGSGSSGKGGSYKGGYQDDNGHGGKPNPHVVSKRKGYYYQGYGY
ncbi:hypothetical protein EC9_14010 [Rosistilla ulvae]|uniref:Uncharacterized protein n=1 Tax=Rosistilla ulvae TaxID=1930277 RepID=A0A517LX74_9BACT|nr:hypothetical protein [Rosistilla ulvae]QDS87223.1 hypothetical protein EC9_14010 [Rosistilla ulvae]